jgi:hypothetical protein
MMTREELLDSFAKRRARKISLTWGQFASAIGGAPVDTKAAILAAANKSDSRALFTLLNGVVIATKKAMARAEVDAIAADDTLTVDELIALLS